MIAEIWNIVATAHASTRPSFARAHPLPAADSALRPSVWDQHAAEH
jgi:hypothetical protein